VADKREILKTLNDKGIPFVIIGGLALRIYGSPRITQDIDLAIRTVDVDDVIGIMYAGGYYGAQKIVGERVRMILSASAAQAWVESSKAGSLTFVNFGRPLAEELIPLSQIDINTEIDFLFELSIPILRLKENAKSITIDEIQVLVAAPSDLLILKRNRKDKSSADEADIAFLATLLKRK
jgi:predicted nucleotidyltransferase